MKSYKLISFIVGAFVLVLASCEPKEDRAELKNNVTVDQVELVVTSSTTGGNEITLKMNTPGVVGYWDYNLGRAYTDEVTIIYPIPGTSTFTFTGSLGAEFFEKTIDVTIDQIDHPIADEWIYLVSEDIAAGKTWVFFKDNPEEGGGGPLWWYMSPPDDPSAYLTAWWNAGGTCCPPGDGNGEMSFNLDGAANYIYNDGNGNIVNASFVLDVAKMRLVFNGENILGQDDARINPNGVYEVVRIDDNNLVLYTPNNGGGTGWTWWFKPKP